MEHGHDEYARAQTGDGRPRVAGALAAIRSMLPHPDATAEVRSAMAAQRRQAAEHLAEDDVELRAGLLGALTIGVVLIGRNADLLAKLPEKTFGPQVVAAGRVMARIVPNLHLYVPPRVVATGRAGVSVVGYVGQAAAYGALYVLILLVLSALIFRRRDFA